jgi:starch-binding outer membrane protein, SusD/RagB family
MKRYQYIILFFAGACMLASCKKDFLELYPEGQVNVENFYKSTKDFQQAITGAYVPLRDVANIAFFMDEMRSDNAHYTYNQKDRGGLGFEQLADFMDDAQNGVISTRYQANYNGISRTNVILDRLATIDFVMAESDKKQIAGEAKALRAHYYFDLVRHYGAVPLHLHEVTSTAGASLPRTGADTIYNQIIADFTDALTALAPPDKFPQSGHITRGAVATELALVYMTLKQFDKAVPLLQSVTQMGYALQNNYKDVFDPAADKKNGKESIFEVQYKATGSGDGQSSGFIYRFIPVTTTTTNLLGVNYNNGSGGWNVPSDDILHAYEPGDQRLHESIALVAGHFNSNVDFIPDSVEQVGYTPPAGVIVRRFVKKYYHPPYTFLPSRTEFNAPENWILYRYADALLMLAESYNETGKPGDALPHLNAVRKRAGLSDITTTDQQQLRDIIAHERRIELAFENHRWPDLVRTGKAIAVMTAYGTYMKQTYGYLLPASFTVTENRLVYAIPFREIQLNKKLVQNTGY